MNVSPIPSPPLISGKCHRIYLRLTGRCACLLTLPASVSLDSHSTSGAFLARTDWTPKYSAGHDFARAWRPNFYMPPPRSADVSGQGMVETIGAKVSRSIAKRLK